MLATGVALTTSELACVIRNMRAGTKIVVGSLVGAVAIHVAFVACSGGGSGSDGGILDALLGDSPVQAGTDGGSCGCISQVVTADTDSKQLRQGVVSTAPGKLIDGPFVLTDLQSYSSTNETTVHLVPSATTCPATAVSTFAFAHTGSYFSGGYVALSSEIHGGRYFVPAGQMLCAYNPGGLYVSWAGFVPYQ